MNEDIDKVYRRLMRQVMDDLGPKGPPGYLKSNDDENTWSYLIAMTRLGYLTGPHYFTGTTLSYFRATDEGEAWLSLVDSSRPIRPPAPLKQAVKQTRQEPLRGGLSSSGSSLADRLASIKRR